MRIVIVTDSHLAPAAPACNANWGAVREYAARTAADLTVHLGDITLDAATDPGQLDSARGMCLPWPTPFRFLPGNHDIGDNPPAPDVAPKRPVEVSLLERFRSNFGPDYWAVFVEDWLMIGLNAQLFGSGIPSETEQWQWLDHCAARAGKHPVVLLLHKPLFQNTSEDAIPHIRYIPLEPRGRLLRLLAPLDLRLVLSGHTHQYLDRKIEGVRHIWIPSTGFFLPDADQERVGEKITGLGVLELSCEHFRFDLICPDGLARNNFADQPFRKLLRD
jgi:3',5'-cyclic AMP phosphodiesterase CpdA